MITIVRVDDKLLHGQVAFSWVRSLKIHTNVIADDLIAYDEFIKMTLGLSKPYGVNLKILEIKEAVAFFKEHLEDDLHIMAIVNSLENACRLIKDLPCIREVNLGSLREKHDTVSISESIAMNEGDRHLCRGLMEHGIRLEIRLRYDDKGIDMKQLMDCF